MHTRVIDYLIFNYELLLLIIITLLMLYLFLNCYYLFHNCPRNELRFVLTNINCQLTQDEIEELISDADQNHDGFISFEGDYNSVMMMMMTVILYWW